MGDLTREVSSGQKAGFYASVDHTWHFEKMLDVSRILEPFLILPE